MVSFKDFMIGALISVVVGSFYILETQVKQLQDMCLDQRNLLNELMKQTAWGSDIKNIGMKITELDENFHNDLSKSQNSIEDLKRDLHISQESIQDLKLEVSGYNLQTDKVERLMSSLLEEKKQVQQTVGENKDTLPTVDLTDDFIVFDDSSLSKDTFMARNKTMISNTKFVGVIPGTGSDLSFYDALADIQLTKKKNVKFRLKIQHRWIRAAYHGYFLFSVHICTRTDIEKNNPYSESRVSIFCHSIDNEHIKCTETATGNFWKSAEMLRMTTGESSVVSFEVQINGPEGTITYRDYNTGKHLFTFNDVDFTSPLIPAFALSSKNHNHLQLTIF